MFWPDLHVNRRILAESSTTLCRASYMIVALMTVARVSASPRRRRRRRRRKSQEHPRLLLILWYTPQPSSARTASAAERRGRAALRRKRLLRLLDDYLHDGLGPRLFRHAAGPFTVHGYPESQRAEEIAPHRRHLGRHRDGLGRHIGLVGRALSVEFDVLGIGEHFYRHFHDTV